MPSKSGNPAKAASQKKVTSAKNWKTNAAQMELDLPSGNTCLVKRPGLPKLIASGVLPDMLTGIAQNAVDMGQTGKAPDEAELAKKMAGVMGEEGGLETILESFDRVTAFCVVEPTVAFHKRQVESLVTGGKEHSEVWEDIPEEDRDEDILYTDVVDMEDKMFIFNFVVGGTADLVEFRAGLGQSMDSLAAITGSPKDAS